MGRTGRLSQAQLNYILENRDKMSLRAIAKQIGCSHEWINYTLKARGFTKTRVKVNPIWVRLCKVCRVEIRNARANEYCPKCRHMVLAKSFYRINRAKKEAKRK